MRSAAGDTAWVPDRVDMADLREGPDGHPEGAEAGLRSNTYTARLPRLTMPASINWDSDFLGVAYRYYDFRMNVVPLFPERSEAVEMWMRNIRKWVNSTIRLRFVEIHDDVWFIVAAESKLPDSNRALFKVLPRSANYERFKKWYGGEAYIRLGIYQKKYGGEVRDNAVCNCKHTHGDHDEEEGYSCLYEECECKGFESFLVTLLRNKKTITDIKFLSEGDVGDDPLAWNCLYVNRQGGEPKA